MAAPHPPAALGCRAQGGRWNASTRRAGINPGSPGCGLRPLSPLTLGGCPALPWGAARPLHSPRGRSAEAGAAVPGPQGPGATYPLGASSQLKGLLLTVIFTVFQLLQDLVQHHRPLFLRGLCGSPDGNRGGKNTERVGRREERGKGVSNMEGGEAEEGREGQEANGEEKTRERERDAGG